ncbi:MAG: septal ring lytic transglycosylase RlpA family protein [Campylobacterales bacterium]|nr:septal ring lytic transglycosylase RlpA family protein [Campylobacterales bacterium]
MKKVSVHYALLMLVISLFLTTGCSQKEGVYKSGGSKFTSAARHRATMREYCVLGKTYKPTYVSVGQTMKGISSWYGPNFHGKMTSNGEIYNMNGMTAAHKTWPMDTMVKVKNMDNGTSTIVRINDRGPFVQGRIIDCSYAAGKRLGLDRTGIARVKLKVIGFAGQIQSDAMIAKSIREHKVQRIVLTDFGVQVGAFRRYEGAQIYKRQYAALDKRYQPIIKRFDDVDGAPLYRVWMMGFKSEDEAKDFILCHDLSGAFIIRN